MEDMLSIHVSTRFERSFKKMPPPIREDFAKRIELFRVHPFDPLLTTHKLSGKLKDYYAFYLRDGYRVLFDFAAQGVALLINIGSHDDYQKWAKSA